MKKVENIEYNIIKFGRTEIRPQAASSARAVGQIFYRKNRICCGSSCAPSGESYAGTFGAIVSDANGKHFALSNNHVFAACNHIEKDMPIMSPAGSDVIPNSAVPLAIFKHSDIIEIRSGYPLLVPKNRMDAAIAEVIDIKSVSSFQGNFYDTPTSVINPTEGLRVKKVGRTTSLTIGTIKAKMNTMKLPYKTKYFNAVTYFEECWIVDPDENAFAAPGDSGSLVVTEDEKFAVGLLFAVSGEGYGIFAPISGILKNFSLNLVTGM
ncbi:hypothetical protein [Leptospira sp. GIMC2001]|uniref:hypothetical protein n=1 Tax=Leptospira sp. GIMC2001 TaxID=1513297 RepID=UPI00234B2481|nr:hypothetical protein [Leptospira sp. GIMC2001]WCL50781.1 hypothetical protein O4O04_08205 [Leptospira sp. GIMC2001]